MGYAHSYNLWRGWRPAYPETTGYIIPTLIDLGQWLKDDRLTLSAERAGQWLLSIQSSGGFYTDLTGNAQVFDTAQVLRGLLALFQLTGQSAYQQAAQRAAHWLVSEQDPDGAWRRNAYHGIAHTYYSYAAAALIKAGIILREPHFLLSAEKQAMWVIRQENKFGLYERMAFDQEPPYSHTILYVVQGLLELYLITQNKMILKSLLKAADKLLIMEKNDGLIRSQYKHDGRLFNSEVCTAGLAQWADVAVNLYRQTFRREFFKSALSSLEYLRVHQLVKGSKDLFGAHPSSVPFWGRYGRFSMFNWTTKFFIDAELSFERVRMQEESGGLDVQETHP